MSSLKIGALLAAVVLNSTPLYDGYRMIKMDSTGSFVPLPWCAMLCNASLWTIYGVRLYVFFFNALSGGKLIFDVLKRHLRVM
jgi:hypothetical protein